MISRAPAWWSVLAFGLMAQPSVALACATCFGASDDLMAKGMNMGILSLLAVVVAVLGLFAAFFVFLARRAVHTPMPKSATNSNAMVKA